MKNLKSIALVTLLYFGSTVANAQEHSHKEGTNPQHHHDEKKADHDNSKAPHGGKIEEAGGYHIELVNKDGKVLVYLLDGKAKPMSNKGITGSATLLFSNKTTSKANLKPEGDEGFTIDLKNASDFATVIVSFKINGKAATAKFKNQAATAMAYSCPMHTEVKSDKPGKCSKCGMDLEKKN
jgi:hypothetical protein